MVSCETPYSIQTNSNNRRFSSTSCYTLPPVHDIVMHNLIKAIHCAMHGIYLSMGLWATELKVLQLWSRVKSTLGILAETWIYLLHTDFYQMCGLHSRTTSITNAILTVPSCHLCFPLSCHTEMNQSHHIYLLFIAHICSFCLKINRLYFFYCICHETIKTKMAPLLQIQCFPHSPLFSPQEV